MKKAFLALAALAFVLPHGAYASSQVLLTTPSIAVTQGDTFTVSVTVAPEGDTVYTSNVSFNYPTDKLEEVSFTYEPKWLPLTQPGFDSVDTTTGTIIKTAGYPQGFTTAKQFGTITFRALAPGAATVTVGDSTKLLNENNKNVFSGTGTTLKLDIASTTHASVVSSTTTGKASQVSSNRTTSFGKGGDSAASAGDAATGATTTTEGDITSGTSSSDQVAAVATATKGSSRAMVYYLLLAVVVIAGGAALFRKKPEASK